ncbi:hypothetical protein [Bradyrhizobium sp. C9]|uniref:hypothetical protein n=1 Tax=Bradyrhizobium sp. C9 TaxID=142585 RepID=UPI000BE89A58|nr:hypothetical protein [Bradyrhizobium sp. C9]PDT70888.1 hypothetical protein CO675_37250 [Bradyrhizobium sp. C9]
MSETGDTPPPSPPPPSSVASGCLPFLTFMAGALMLLPAVCTVLGSLKSDIRFRAADLPILLVIGTIGFVGAWLVWLATRPRKY